MSEKPISDLVNGMMDRLDLHPKVAGIDPSLTNTAIVVGNGKDWTLREFSAPATRDDSVVSRIERYDALVSSIIDWMESQGPLEAIYIEGYAFAKNAQGGRWLTECGGILRWHLVDLAETVIEVPPATLKKFVAGKGNAPKDSMKLKVFQNWSQEFDSHDAADAFGLYKLGLVAEEIAEAKNAAQRDAVAKVKESFLAGTR